VGGVKTQNQSPKITGKRGERNCGFCCSGPERVGVEGKKGEAERGDRVVTEGARGN